jgi:hypothetical protein
LHRSHLQSGVPLEDLPPSLHNLWLDVFAYEHWEDGEPALYGIIDGEHAREEHDAELLKDAHAAGQPTYFDYLLNKTRAKVLKVRFCRVCKPDCDLLPLHPAIL